MTLPERLPTKLKCSMLPYEYELRHTVESFGPLSLEVFCLASLDQTIDDLFDILNRQGTPELLETLCPYFGTVWPAARALTEELLALDARTPLRTTPRILELGCGLALPSIAAALKGARPVATDCHPDIEAFLELNVQANLKANLEGSRIDYRPLDWRNPEQLGPLGKFDWVVASDVLYEKAQPALVARSIRESLQSSQSHYILTDPGRPYLQEFADEAKRLGLSCEIKTRTVADPGAEMPQVIGRTRDVFVLTGSLR
jgi:predicted nicotinamide N-methyase